MFFNPRIPHYVSNKFRDIDQQGLGAIQLLLKDNYFADCRENYLLTDCGRQDLLDHLIERLERDRKSVIPWLDNAKPLLGSSILEIGCGTGCSTVALAEQGAQITAVDIDQKALVVAKERCKIYGLNVSFFNANATEVDKMFSGKHFDFIIFYASLEHMTFQERMTAMKKTWNMLSSGDLWCVVEAPNRLWYYDPHTSLLPFYSWLPDDLAFEYSRFSPRDNFCRLFRKQDSDSNLRFVRYGRGISFHEFELAMKPVEQLNIISSMPAYYRKQNLLERLKRRFSLEYRYQALLSKLYPKINKCFFSPWLFLIIRKD